MSNSSGLLLEDTFKIDSINVEGKRYKRVSRIQCSNAGATTHVTADINTEEFPLSTDDGLTITLASSLERAGNAGKPTYDHSVYHRDTRLNDCDYAMHGHVYTIERSKESDEVRVFISCGGLLMCISGSLETLKAVQYNTGVYVLIKRIGK